MSENTVGAARTSKGGSGGKIPSRPAASAERDADKARIADLAKNASERLKPYLEGIASRLESGEVNDETALLLTTGAIVAVAKFAPKGAKTRAFRNIRSVLRRITGRIGLSRRKRELVPILLQRGTKITPDAIVDIRRLRDGRIVWLEAGDLNRGLEHIVKRHSDEFASIGISEKQIPDAIFAALERGRFIGYQGGDKTRLIYEYFLNNRKHRIAVTIGGHGFIVGANPRSVS